MIVLLLESPSAQGWAASMGSPQQSESGNTESWGPQLSSLETWKPKPTEVQQPVQQCSPWKAEPGLLPRE